jgi:hypothetical protein
MVGMTATPGWKKYFLHKNRLIFNGTRYKPGLQFSDKERLKENEVAAFEF